MNNSRGNAILIILGIVSLTSVFLFTMLPLLNKGQRTNMTTAYEADADNAFDFAVALLSAPYSCNIALQNANLVAVGPTGAPWSAIPGAQIALNDEYGRPALSQGQKYNNDVLIKNIQLYDLGTVSNYSVLNPGVNNLFHAAAVTLQMQTINQSQSFTITKTVYLYIIANAAGTKVASCDISSQVTTLTAAFVNPVVAPNVTGQVLIQLYGQGAFFGINPVMGGSLLFTASSSMGNGGGTVTAATCVPDGVAGTTLSTITFGFLSPVAASPVNYTQVTTSGFHTRCLSSMSGPLVWIETAYQAPAVP